MKLSDYMELTGTSIRTLAAAIGSRPAVVSRYLLGRRRPSPEKIRAIHRATRGAVGPADWYDLTLSADETSPALECAK